MGLTTYDERTPIACVATIDVTSTTIYQTLVPIGLAPRRVDNVIALSLCAAAHAVYIAMWDGTTNYDLGATSVPTGSGLNGTPLADISTPLYPAGRDGWVLPANFGLRCKVLSTLPAGEAIEVIALGGYV